jgi:hypothetical protein
MEEAMIIRIRVKSRILYSRKVFNELTFKHI